MITITNVNKFNNTIELYGLSSDVKPTDNYKFYSSTYKIRNGSIFYEIDTKQAFMFDEENKEWIKQ